MMKSVFEILVVLAVTTHVGFSMNVDIQPSTVNEIVPKDVMITCSLDFKDDDAITFVSMEVEYDNKLVAKIESEGQVTIRPDFQNKIKAVGDIAKIVIESNFKVTVRNAGSADGGVYTCRGFYTAMTGELKEKKEMGSLTITEAKPEDAVQYLQKKVSGLETRQQQGKQDLTQLVDKENENVLFVATRNTNQTFRASTVMIFNGVVTNEGQGYDNTTGEFTAPFEGYYLFRLSIYSLPYSRLYLYLKSKKGEVLTKLHVGINSKTYDFADTSCVVKLKAGEVVNPYIRHVDNFFKLSKKDSDNLFNTFSGYLLKAL